jgi:hypothetical protein
MSYVRTSSRIIRPDLPLLAFRLQTVFSQGAVQVIAAVEAPELQRALPLLIEDDSRAN